jgi:hypothetical protein
MSEIHLLPADSISVHSRSLLGWLIREAETAPEEQNTYSNHCADITFDRSSTEALWVVTKTPFDQWLQEHGDFEIWRYTGLTQEQRETVARKAESYLGRHYGWWKLLIHLMDAFLTFLRRKETYFFRRIMSYDRYPICSWVEAYAYQAANINFGCEPNVADPDVIYDYKKAHPDHWKLMVKSVRGVITLNES